MSAINTILNSMQAHYQPPWNKTPEQITSSIGEYVRVLKDYPDADLLEAWDRIVASHKTKDETKTPNWPGIDVWKRHLSNIAAEQHRPEPVVEQTPVPRRDIPSDEMIFGSAGGQMALRGSFGLAFRSRCRNAGDVLSGEYAERLGREIGANLAARPPLRTMHHAHQEMIEIIQRQEVAAANKYLQDAA